MEKYTKAVLATLFVMAMICETLCGYCGYAEDEYFNDELFEDVSHTDDCFDAVQYLWSKGIVNIDDGYFHPDDEITSNEFLNWVTKTYQPDMSVTRFVNWYRSNHFSILNELYQESDPICWYQAASVVFNTSGVYVYNSRDYSKNSELHGLADGKLIMSIASSFGFCEEETKTTDMVSRADAANLIFGCLNHTFQSELPELLQDFPIKIEGSVNMQMVLEQFELVPEVVLDEFVDRGWTFIVSQEYMDAYNTEFYPDGSFVAGGVCRYAQKTIGVDGYYAVLHELGHFVDKQTTKDDVIDILFEKEGDAAVQEIREYTGKSSGEFYADFFAQYLSRNASEKAELQEVCPETYEYFVKLEADNWGF